MGLFSRRNKQKTSHLDEIKISFEGETPAFTADYKVTYDDILHGMEVVAANEDKKRVYGGLAILIVCSILAVPRLYDFNKVFCFIFIFFALYLVVGQIFGPPISRRRTAKDVADQQKECRLHLYPGGYQVIEKRTLYNVPFRVVTCYESEKAYIFKLINNNMMVFNKEIFGENNPLVREIFIANMGQGRRYFLVDENGKIISNQARYNESN